MDFKVSEMSCDHCVATIEKSVQSADPLAEIACDLETRTVSVQSTLSAEKIRTVITDAGYEAEALD